MSSRGYLAKASEKGPKLAKKSPEKSVEPDQEKRTLLPKELKSLKSGCRKAHLHYNLNPSQFELNQAISPPLPTKMIEHFSKTLGEVLSAEPKVAEPVPRIFVSTEPYTITFAFAALPAFQTVFKWMEASCTGLGEARLENVAPELSLYQLHTLREVAAFLQMNALEDECLCSIRSIADTQVPLDQAKLAYRTNDLKLRELVAKSVAKATMEHRLEEEDAYLEFANEKDEFMTDVARFRDEIAVEKAEKAKAKIPGAAAAKRVELVNLRWDRDLGMVEWETDEPVQLGEGVHHTPEEPLGEQYLSIPTLLAGWVIGRGGSTINEIRKTAGVYISVDKEGWENPDERWINVAGKVSKVEHAVRLLCDTLEAYKSEHPAPMRQRKVRRPKIRGRKGNDALQGDKEEVVEGPKPEDLGEFPVLGSGPE